MKRFEIVGREHGADREVVICMVSTNPDAIIEAVKAKTKLVASRSGFRRISVNRYEHVYVREVEV